MSGWSSSASTICRERKVSNDPTRQTAHASVEWNAVADVVQQLGQVLDRAKEGHVMIRLEMIRSHLLAAKDGVEDWIDYESDPHARMTRIDRERFITCKCVLETALKLLDGQDAGVQRIDGKRRDS